MLRLLSSILLLLSIASLVLSQPDLCRNARLDSIAYMSDIRMFFFTSGGFYWHLKDSEFPPTKEKAKPLQNGFKTGDAAIYMNTLDVCSKSIAPNKPQEKQIYLLEKTSNGNQFMLYDVRGRNWTQPKNLDSDRVIGRVQIDYEKAVNAMFEYKPTEIYVVQGRSYASIDYSNICDNSDGYATPISVQSTDTIGTKSTIDAMTLIDQKSLYMFIGDKFWNLKINENESKKGKIVTTKFGEKQIKTEFFKFVGDCPGSGDNSGPSPTSPPSPPPPPSDGNEQTQPPVEGGNDGTVSEANKPSNEEGSSGSSGLIIIGVIVVIVIVVLIIGVVVFVLMNKKKESEGLPKTSPEADKVETAPKPSEKVPPQIGTNAVPVMAIKPTTAQSMPPKSSAKK